MIAYHGTNAENAERILAEGFRIGPERVCRILGDAVYLAVTAEEAWFWAAYVQGEEPAYLVVDVNAEQMEWMTYAMHERVVEHYMKRCFRPGPPGTPQDEVVRLLSAARAKCFHLRGTDTLGLVPPRRRVDEPHFQWMKRCGGNQVLAFDPTKLVPRRPSAPIEE